MPRTAVVVIGWAAATAAAVAVAYAGVSVVAGRVVDPLPSSLALQPTASPSDDPTGVSTDASPAPSSPDPTTESAAPVSPTPTSAPSTPPPTVAPTTPPPVTSPPVTEDATPTAQPETRSYALVGGTATLRFEPGRVTLVQAEPAQGFTLDVEGDGTSEITVDFENDDHRSRVRGWWEDGGPRDRVEEDGEGSGSDGGSDDD